MDPKHGFRGSIRSNHHRLWTQSVVLTDPLDHMDAKHGNSQQMISCIQTTTDFDAKYGDNMALFYQNTTASMQGMVVMDQLDRNTNIIDAKDGSKSSNTQTQTLTRESEDYGKKIN
eukprot:971174_1